jgi:hypothetical protein
MDLEETVEFQVRWNQQMAKAVRQDIGRVDTMKHPYFADTISYAEAVAEDLVHHGSFTDACPGRIPAEARVVMGMADRMRKRVSDGLEKPEMIDAVYTLENKASRIVEEACRHGR